MKYIDELKDFEGKRVLVRDDFNVENSEDAVRLFRSIPTLKYLLAGGAKVIIVSHRGRPKGKVVPEFSLRPMLDFLTKNVDAKAQFIAEHNFADIQKKIAEAYNGSLFLLENIRFLAGEESSDLELAKNLASLADIYVNDAFAVSHRAGASITVVPTLIPAYAGLLVKDEVANLSKVMLSPKQPLVVVVGGGKAVDKFAVIRNLYKEAGSFLIGGVLANTFLKAKGVDVGESKIDSDILEEVAKLMNDSKVVLPVDWISEDGKIYDLGQESTKIFAEKIKQAGTIIWSGPVGFFEDPRYFAGSKGIAEAVVASSAFSVVGGSETTQVVSQLKMEDKISFVSTGGGAMLDFLAGKKLPGIEVLN
jgi:phosphoglycerate kinase